MIDRKKMCVGEFAEPVNTKGLATLRLDSRAGPGAVISPYRCRGKVSMHLLLELDHFDLDNLSGFACGADYGREGEWIHIAGKSDAATYQSGCGHRLTENWYTFAECNSGCRIEAALEKSTSVQHRSKPKPMFIFVGGVFIRSVSSRVSR
jgi:hypothetical protein